MLRRRRPFCTGAYLILLCMRPQGADGELVLPRLTVSQQVTSSGDALCTRLDTTISCTVRPGQMVTDDIRAEVVPPQIIVLSAVGTLPPSALITPSNPVAGVSPVSMTLAYTATDRDVGRTFQIDFLATAGEFVASARLTVTVQMPRPTNTPTPTWTVLPTQRPTTTPTRTPSSTPTPTPTPFSRLGCCQFGAGSCASPVDSGVCAELGGTFFAGLECDLETGQCAQPRTPSPTITPTQTVVRTHTATRTATATRTSTATHTRTRTATRTSTGTPHPYEHADPYADPNRGIRLLSARGGIVRLPRLPWPLRRIGGHVRSRRRVRRGDGAVRPVGNPHTKRHSDGNRYCNGYRHRDAHTHADSNSRARLL